MHKTTTMLLELNGLEVTCIIGDRPDEREREQVLSLDIALTLPDTAGMTDLLSDTVDYAALADALRTAIVDARCQMIERVAYLATQVCLAQHGVVEAKVRVTKCGAIAGLESASATYQERKSI